MSSENNNFMTFSCVRALLLLFNVIFWFSGLTVVWIGLWLSTDLLHYLSVSTQHSPYAPYVFVVIGTTIIFVTSMACACIVKVQPTMLVVYGGFLITILFTLISLSVYVYTYRDMLKSGVSAGLHREIGKYNSTEAETSKGTLIDFIQKNLRCCGNESFHDWDNKSVPKTCMNISLRHHDLNELKIGHSYFPLGCSYKLRQYIHTNLTTVGVVSTAITFFPLLGTILAIGLAFMSDKMSYERIA